MSSNITMTLLITVVLWNVVQVLATNNQGTLHLGGNNDTVQDTATDGYGGRGEGALLVNVGSLDSFLGGLEAQTNVVEPTLGLLLGSGALGVEENSLLELEGLFGLLETGTE